MDKMIKTPGMKKVILFLMVLSVVLLMACGEKGEAKAGNVEAEAAGTAASEKTAVSAASAEQVSAPAGEMLDKPYCSVLVPDGWKQVAFDDSKAVQVIKEGGNNQLVSLKIMGSNVTEQENKTLFESQMKSYNAGFGENRTIGGVDCMCASYTVKVGNDDYRYVHYQGVKEGNQISVQVCNMDIEDQDVKAIIESMVFKTDQ